MSMSVRVCNSSDNQNPPTHQKKGLKEIRRNGEEKSRRY
jgi:hypothetical protein